MIESVNVSDNAIKKLLLRKRIQSDKGGRLTKGEELLKTDFLRRVLSNRSRLLGTPYSSSRQLLFF